ncbi:MAG: glycoside hydrolase family 5 protein [Chloroflexi bacterium]|nr:glycoside hydrolase family 5 protein [Chloroflexota bacterium]
MPRTRVYVLLTSGLDEVVAEPVVQAWAGPASFHRITVADVAAVLDALQAAPRGAVVWVPDVLRFATEAPPTFWDQVHQAARESPAKLVILSATWPPREPSSATTAEGLRALAARADAVYQATPGGITRLHWPPPHSRWPHPKGVLALVLIGLLGIALGWFGRTAWLAREGSADRVVLHPDDGYIVVDGRLYSPQGQRIHVRGINWFGFETQDHVVHGLWARPWREIIDQMAQLGFNAVRVPICPDTLRGVPVSSIDYYRNPDLQGKNSLEILDLVLEELDRQGFYILLDHHRPDCEAISELWYTDTYSEDQWIQDLVFLARRYAHLPHFMGLDLKNEPHGRATWGTGNLATDWDKAAARAAKAVLRANPRLLVFVEGVQENPICSGPLSHWYGGNLEPLACTPLDIPVDKLVLSPHVYGPDVYVQGYFNDPRFPDNMPAIWEQHFGRFADQYAMVIGEWGGKYGQGDPRDRVWHEAFVDYLIDKGIYDSFYWALNPDSGDTGGILLDDWVHVREDKMALLRRFWAAAQEEPTR